jgi:hypothetical protein
MQEQDDDREAVIALAGRRIDAIDAEAARFPLHTALRRLDQMTI